MTGRGGPLCVVSAKRRAEVEKEIRNHSKWCTPSCQVFSATAYRLARYERSAKQVQDDYDASHATR